VQCAELIVLAPFLLVRVILPESFDLTAEHFDRSETITIFRRLMPVAVQLQVGESVGQAAADRPATASTASRRFGAYAPAARPATAIRHET
jgi:hypothetical protein